MYTLEAHVPGTLEAQERCWGNIPIWGIEAMNVAMTKELTLK
jgi:hypothetical protein